MGISTRDQRDNSTGGLCLDLALPGKIISGLPSHSSFSLEIYQVKVSTDITLLAIIIITDSGKNHQ